MSDASHVQIVKVDGKNSSGYLGLVESLANYEHLAPPSEEAKARLIAAATSSPPLFQAYLALVDERPVGYITFFFTYSTFLAKPTLFLEDIFVLEEERKRGIGSKLFAFCVQEAKRHGCGRMEWTALDWNVNALDFYQRMGGKKQPWLFLRLNAEDFDEAIEKAGD